MVSYERKAIGKGIESKGQKRTWNSPCAEQQWWCVNREERYKTQSNFTQDKCGKVQQRSDEYGKYYSSTLCTGGLGKNVEEIDQVWALWSVLP